MAATLAVVGCFQAVYWSRLRWVGVPVFASNALIHHVVLFLSRVSFVFGGAFFSLVSFRHLPALAGAPDISSLLGRGGLLLAILFSLFCYSLEVERIGKAFGEPPPAGAGTDDGRPT
jgi:hypothetical protein